MGNDSELTDALNDDEDGNAKKDTKKKFRNAQGNISHVDVESPDLEKYPDFAKATPMDVILGPATSFTSRPERGIMSEVLPFRVV